MPAYPTREGFLRNYILAEVTAHIYCTVYDMAHIVLYLSHISI